jgi:hypothetical protein
VSALLASSCYRMRHALNKGMMPSATAFGTNQRIVANTGDAHIEAQPHLVTCYAQLLPSSPQCHIRPEAHTLATRSIGHSLQQQSSK